jgi:hypothetical protein
MENSNLPKIPLTTTSNYDLFSSSATFNEITDFVINSFPDSEIKNSWGTIFVVSNDLEVLSSKLSLPIQSHLLIDDSVTVNLLNQRIVYVASGGPAAIITDKFSSLSDAMTSIKACNYESEPSVLVHTSKTPKVYSFFEAGIKNNRTLTTPVGGAFSEILFQNLSEALNWVEENTICPAWNIDLLWQIPDKFVPQLNSERRVQNLLRNGLAAILGKSFVLEETSNAAGRADMVILPKNPKFRVSYIELKVVKTFHSVNDIKSDTPNKVSNTKNRRWALSAIRQAAAYRGKNANADAHARIYDMRKDRTEIIPDANTRAAAQKRNVVINARLLHPTTEAIQEEVATG